jgi:hypothetical protein
MYFEAMEPHHTSHFHAYYQDEVAVYQINLVFLTKVWVQCVELKKCAFPCLAEAKQDRKKLFLGK